MANGSAGRGCPHFMSRTTETPRLRAERRSQFVQYCTNDGPRGHCRRPVPPLRTHMDLLTWVIVGIIAGLIASSVGGGIGMWCGDVDMVGVVCVCVGGWILR